MRHESLFPSLIALLAVGCQQPATEPAAPEPAPTAIVAEAQELLPNQRQPIDGAISGGQPSSEQLTGIRDAGYKTVLNMRNPAERGVGNEAEIVGGLGMDYLSIPINGADGLTRENVDAFAEALESAEYPLVVHCGSGNRIGAMFALKAFWIDGKGPEEALQIGRDAGLTRLEGAVQELMSADS